MKNPLKVEGFGLVSSHGHAFVRYVQEINDLQRINRHNWIKSEDSDFYEVIMSATGHWQTTNNDTLIDSVCVYNIIPDENCTKCTDKAFCRYIDSTRQETRCVCPVGRGGDHCEIDLCARCQNGGICRENKDSEDGLTCVCPRPFFGENCDSSKQSNLV